MSTSGSGQKKNSRQSYFEYAAQINYEKWIEEREHREQVERELEDTKFNLGNQIMHERNRREYAEAEVRRLRQKLAGLIGTSDNPLSTNQ